jgi:hypothetical protein
VRRRAAERVLLTADEAIQVIKSFISDPTVPAGVRLRAAQDLADRAGLAAAQVHKIVPSREDPVIAFFEGVLSDPSALMDTSPPGRPQPAIEAYTVDPPEPDAEPEVILEAELIDDAEPGDDTPPPSGADDQGRRVRPESGEVTMPRPLPPVDESHQIMLSAWKALRSTRTEDGKVHVIHNGGEHLSRRLVSVTATAAWRDRRSRGRLHAAVPLDLPGDGRAGDGQRSGAGEGSNGPAGATRGPNAEHLRVEAQAMPRPRMPRVIN